ncbi:unnamed protein product [Arctia plantaginis]|uniref:PWWP domain-containing protein n=1 Tax=Arctia plantaginis TaxID=874455 RepID=A0A8S1AH21_ARCPL|nr:unnamed protein product [Arctia plantaginis]CAB3244630.1 unnamed protein product [Arctia plantaginis]
MCENSAISYLDGEVVWVKLGSCWWPGEVVGFDKLPPDVLPSLRKPPIAVVKFFQEDAYEYVKNANAIYKYDCSRKNEFISKGLNLYRTKHGPMEKFPEDVVRAETATGGDTDILTRDEFQEKKRESYAGIFGDPTKRTPISGKKGKGAKGRPTEYPRTPTRKNFEKVDYKVHILVQGSKTPSSENLSTQTETPTTPSSSGEQESEHKQDDTPDKDDKEKSNNTEKPASFATPVASSSGIYACHACSFTTTRLNVLILHNKTHSVSFTPYTPSPVRKKVTTKPSAKSPETPKVPKVRKPRKEKTEKEPNKVLPTTPIKKRPADEQLDITDTKKIKTDEEIKSSLLADWDDGDEESNDESSVIVMAGSPEVPEAAESPAIPTSADLSSIQVSVELSSPVEKKFNKSPLSDKAEASSDSKYEFCEDEDWPLEADGGRKIPRVKNAKRKEDTKSISLDDDEVAREVAELLNKTTVPELPSAPEPLKVEENFPEPTIVKSPDKDKLPEKAEEKPPEIQPTKAIFKTKTFFRSRHSRSQDAIGKYVAEQLNAVEKMDIAESDINGSEAVSSPETRDSPPIEHVKVARLAPKIQLKKLKAEAAQLRERDKNNLDYFSDFDLNPYAELVASNAASPVSQPDSGPIPKKDDRQLLQDVLYPTQEIKPVNTDMADQIKSPKDKFKYLMDNTNELINQTTVDERDIIQGLENDNTAPRSEKKSTIKESEKVNILVDLEREHILQDSNKEPMEESPEIKTPAHTLLQEQEKNQMVDIQTPDTLSRDQVIDDVIEEPIINMVTPETGIDKVMTEPEMHSVPQHSELPSVIQEPKIQNVIQVPEIQNVIHELQVNATQEPSTKVENVENKFPKTKLQKTYEESIEPFMNESTASAVDALLSVSREADRVTRVISDDPPEDLFEDDNKDSNGMCNDVNGFKENMSRENGADNSKYVETKIIDPDGEENVKESTYNEKPQDIIQQITVDSNTITEVDSVSKNIETIPSESDLQIAETLLNLPSTAIQKGTASEQQDESCSVVLPKESSQEKMNLPSKEMVPNEKNDKSLSEQEPKIPHKKSLLISNNENSGLRYETEQEKSENLNAAQSLVQMSESIDHKISIDHNLSNSVNNNKDIIIPDTGAFHIKQNNGLDSISKPEQKIAVLTSENNNDNTNGKHVKMDTSSSKLLKILEEPCTPKFASNKSGLIKQTSILSGKEKILNFDVAKSSFKGKSDSPKQKIIIRRTTPSRNNITNISDITTADKIILSRTKNPAQDGSVQTYTIQTSPDAPPENNTIIIPQKVRKITKPPMKLQKIKPQNSLGSPITETKVSNEPTTDEAMFDINSMPIVLSEDLLTPESIEKMPIVMSDGNIITHTPNPPKLVKTKQPIENERMTISATTNKPELKTLLMNPVTEANKVTTPNILSKSSKLRGAKPMLVIDKATGKQKIIMTKAEPAVKEVKQTPTLIQAVPQNTGKAEKFIILPTPNSPRPGRTQKIVIDPQTGKAHVLVAKDTQQVSSTENKPVSAKLIPSSTEASTSSSTVMIITNAQGTQSRIVLTPEHEKMLFPKKQQPNVSQLKTIAHRISTNSGATSKTVITSIAPARTQNILPAKTQTRIVPKQKSAIITSKGQLIVGGRVATTAQNIAPMPEIRPVPKRIIASETKKLVQTIQKSSSEPLIFLQQKSGAVMQLTTAQFEHLQRTGQIVQKAPAQSIQEKVIVQKTITVPSNESVVTTVQKPRARKMLMESPAPLKRLKQEIAIAPAPASPVPASPVPTLSPLSNTASSSIVPSISNTVSVSTTSPYSEFDNFEELLPSTAIARQNEPVVTPAASPAVEQAQVAPPPGPISDGQLMAVPGEHFGGPPGSFYLCMEDNGTFTAIDHRPLVLENNQLVPMPEPLPVIGTQPERRDILEAALANSDVFHADTPRDEAPDFRDLNANVSVHCRVSETSTTLNQAPIMTPVEVPTKVDSEPPISSNLEDGLAVIGISAHTVPTSLELPITVTDPRIAPKTTDPLSSTSTYATTGLLPSSNTELTFVSTEETEVSMRGPISMPLLTDDESVGKSMPILTDELAERTVSSVDSTVGSPSSIDVRESENEDSHSQWTRRLLTPGSDTSEASAEIPLQPLIQLSVNELSRHS